MPTSTLEAEAPYQKPELTGRDFRALSKHAKIYSVHPEVAMLMGSRNEQNKIQRLMDIGNDKGKPLNEVLVVKFDRNASLDDVHDTLNLIEGIRGDRSASRAKAQGKYDQGFTIIREPDAVQRVRLFAGRDIIGAQPALSAIK